MKLPKPMRVVRSAAVKPNDAKWASRAVRPSFCPCDLLSGLPKTLCCAVAGCC